MNTVVAPESSLTNADMQDILQDVNSIRHALAIGEGKLAKLPKGVPGNSEQCVLARALSNGWNAQVGWQITLSHFNLEDDEFDHHKAIATLKEKGLSADYDEERYEEDDYVEVKRFINIDLTEPMSQLISEFDDKLLPFLIQED